MKDTTHLGTDGLWVYVWVPEDFDGRGTLTIERDGKYWKRFRDVLTPGRRINWGGRNYGSYVTVTMLGRAYRQATDSEFTIAELEKIA